MRYHPIDLYIDALFQNSRYESLRPKTVGTGKIYKENRILPVLAK